MVETLGISGSEEVSFRITIGEVTADPEVTPCCGQGCAPYRQSVDQRLRQSIGEAKFTQLYKAAILHKVLIDIGEMPLVEVLVPDDLHIIGLSGCGIDPFKHIGPSPVGGDLMCTIKTGVEHVHIEDLTSLACIEQSREGPATEVETGEEVGGPVGLYITDRAQCGGHDGKSIIIDQQLALIISIIAGAPDHAIAIF